jgi:ABC-2 type transport system ATP-binding protein
MPVIATRSLMKRYGDVVAVDRVDLDVPAGEVTGLLGPNGAGKTTLMCLIFGLVRPTAGSVAIFGRPVADDAVAALRPVGGFIETPAFYPYLSARRNLQLLGQLDRDREARLRVPHALETAGLADRADDKVREYSFGMRQRLGIAAALLRGPQLLVVDEPSTGLDPAGIREMRALIRRLAESGITMLVSSHNMLEVEELCGRVTIMRTGSVVFDGSMRELRRRAPDPAYLLRTADDALVVAMAGEVRGITRIERTRGGVRFHAPEPAVEELTRRLGARGVGIRSLAAQEAPLETLFFLLTGGGDGRVETRRLQAAA